LPSVDGNQGASGWKAELEQCDQPRRMAGENDGKASRAVE
jgi:hypothetical protein